MYDARRKERKAMNKEMWEKAHKLLNADIDPIYYEIAGIFGEAYRKSRYLPWLMARYMTVDLARVALALPDPDWRPSLGDLNVSETFAKKLGIDKKTIDSGLLALFEKGFIFPTKRGPRPPRTWLAWFDIQHNSHYRDELGEEWFVVLGMMLDYERSDEADNAMAHRVAAGLPPLSRVVPRWKAIKDVPGLLPSEDIREILKANRSFGLIDCACRQRYPDRECKSPIDVCLVTGRNAEYNIRRRAAKRITREEALDIFTDKTADYSLIHITGRGATPADIPGIICSCHADCCAVLRKPMVIGSLFPVWEHYAKSRFRAVVDLDKCNGCGLCASKRCQFGAAQMRNYPDYIEQRSYTSESICMGCGCCVESCPKGARSMVIVEPPESVTKMPEYLSTMDSAYTQPSDKK
jgi:ferredoxin